MSFLDSFLQEYTVCSDLHIERFYPAVPSIFDFIPKEQIKNKIIFVGDVGRTEFFGTYCKFFINTYPLFKKMILVPGNHEYYGATTKQTIEQLDQKLDFLSEIIPNLTILRNSFITIKKTKIIIFGSTLFSLLPLDFELNLPFFNSKNQLTTAEFNKLFLDSLIQIQKIMFEKPKDYTLVVVTHYAPTFHTTIGEKYNSPTNKRNHLYASHLDFLLKKEKVDLWIYGHTGHNSTFTTDNGTILFSNQICNDSLNKKY
jgi:predicted phosphohydrolase